MTTLTAYIEQDPRTGLVIGIVPGVPGAHTQAKSLDDLRVNLQVVLELLLEEDAMSGTGCPASPVCSRWN